MSTADFSPSDVAQPKTATESTNSSNSEQHRATDITLNIPTPNLEEEQLAASGSEIRNAGEASLTPDRDDTVH